ncbi:MAG: nucleotidyltransferase family protein [Thermoanaerobaculales bacterium]|jgi:predicted nucleotidyltransferase|nr:nucleotidyltransferase family protein [Thermoanaerobaculales bacterium]
MAQRFEPVIRALNDAGVRYLVVGGVAVVLHGHLRTTGDLDLVVELSPDNLGRALDALEASGFQPRPPVPLRSFADPETRRLWVETKNLQVFSLWHPDLPGFEVDLFVEEPFDFDEAWGRRVEVDLEGTSAPIVSLHDLVELKRAAGRARDLADVAVLMDLIREVGDE